MTNQMTEALQKLAQTVKVWTIVRYSYEGQDYQFNLDLSKLEAREQLIKIVRWCSRQMVEIKITSIVA